MDESRPSLREQRFPSGGIYHPYKPRNFVPETRLAGIVPFLAKHAGRAYSGLTNIHTQQIAALRRTWKGDVIRTTGKNKIGVPEAVNAGVPVWNLLVSAGGNDTLLRQYSALLRFLRSKKGKSIEEILRGSQHGNRAKPLPKLTPDEVLEAPLEKLEKLVNDGATTRADLECIAIHRFGVPRGSMRSLSNREMLVDKLWTLIGNERTHQIIGAVARGEGRERR